jgi:NDP-sugar pyrophosphorylase family protein
MSNALHGLTARVDEADAAGYSGGPRGAIRGGTGGGLYALILSGGRGERLRPLTDSIPKPMVPLCGKPILWHQVHWLRSAGVTDVVFLAGYRWEAIREYFGDGAGFGVRVQYSVEDTPLGRGGAIRLGMGRVPRTEEQVIATNGDVVSRESLERILHQFLRRREVNPQHQATVMVVPFVSPYGLVELDGEGLIREFREKAELPYWINAGVYILARDIEARLPELGDHESSTFPALASEGSLEAFRSRAFWRSVDSFKDLREAEERMKGTT